MKVNGAACAKAQGVTFTGVGSIAFLGSVFIFWVFLLYLAIRDGVEQEV
jgi:hypothetical protein